MTRLSVLLSRLVCASGLACAAASMALAQGAPVSPLSAGDSWTYHVTGGLAGQPGRSEWKEYILTSKNTSNEFVVTEYEKPTRELLDAALQAKEQPAIFSTIGADLCAIDFLSKATLTGQPCTAPLKVGDSWKTNEHHFGFPADAVLKAIRSEKIKLPSGSFDAFVIEVTVPVPPEQAARPQWAAHPPVKVRGLYWYDPAIKAILKEDMQGIDASGRAVFKLVAELQEFVVR
jgi:hypothetical protein